jgi:exosortase/archaeosortase family protein
MQLSAGRSVSAAGMIAGAVTLVVGERTWRGFETDLSARMIQIVTSRTTVGDAPGSDIFILESHSRIVEAVFNVTSECSVGYLVAAVLGISAFLLAIAPLKWWRVGAALLSASAVLLAFNVLRLTIIGAAVAGWGDERGFQIGHVYFGSFLTLVGTVAAGVAYAMTLLWRSSALADHRAGGADGGGSATWRPAGGG